MVAIFERLGTRRPESRADQSASGVTPPHEAAESSSVPREASPSDAASCHAMPCDAVAGASYRIRLLQESDTEWLVSLCKRVYSAKYDSDAATMWFTGVVLRGPLMFHPMRSANAFCISMVSILPWLPSEVEGNVCMIAAEPGHMWEAAALLRESVEWARKRKCAIWRCVSETDYDLGPIALRLGAREVSARYVLRF